MLGFSFFGNRQPRKFQYRPRYYDPDKEELEQRKRMMLGDKYEESKDGEYKPGQYIRDMRLRRGIVADRQRRERKMRRRQWIIVLALALLLFMLWYLFKTTWLMVG